MNDPSQHFPTSQQALAAKILNWSDYLKHQLSRHPEWVEHLLLEPDTLPSLQERIASAFESVTDENRLLSVQRLIRNREMCRIAWRDLSRATDLHETFTSTSELASYLVDYSLQWHHEQLQQVHGIPHDEDGVEQSLIVLGMGKLGGGELNFSSDIDLIFAFPRKGQTDGRRPLDNQSYFIRLGQRLINSLNKNTADGIVYRVDMRLRPFGKSGALATPFAAVEHYYETHGREWERYALIKARPIAGDIAAGEALLQRLKPFFYRTYLDYGSLEHLREMKGNINQEALRRGKNQDVKLGEGGIREIEFIAQSFQLVRGGRLQALQTQSLFKTLSVIAEQRLMPASDVKDLEMAYHFLRHTENRLQMWQDQQTHALPNDSHQQAMLAASMGFANWLDFVDALQAHQQLVARHFAVTFSTEDDSDSTLDQADPWLAVDDQDKCLNKLRKLHYQRAETTLEAMQRLKNSRFYDVLTETARDRLETLMPLLIMQCAEMASPDLALQRALSVIEKIAGRSGYLSLLANDKTTLHQFIQLIHASSWIATEIRDHPILLDELLDPRQFYRIEDKSSLRMQLREITNAIDPDDTEQVMEVFRTFKRSQVLRVAAIDILNVIPLMKVSDQLSWLAEVIMEGIQAFAWQHVVNKHGVPQCEVDGELIETGFLIVAYGKLGGIELSYQSDLDLVFLHNNNGKKAYTKTENDQQKSIDSSLFYARVAQRIVSLCSTLTYNGRLYEVDTRLRPNGNAGMMVSSLESFKRYQSEKAWTWERQSLVRARPIGNDKALIHEFNHIRHHILTQASDPSALRTEVREMREKMWKELDKSKAGFTHLKKSPGGITDIEFIVQYLVLAHAHKHPSITQFSDNIRLLEACVEYGVVPQNTAAFLIDSYKSLRSYIHAQALQAAGNEVKATMFIKEREGIKQIWQNLLEAQ